jgi:hypothetical protein
LKQSQIILNHEGRDREGSVADKHIAKHLKRDFAEEKNDMAENIM